MLGFLKDRLARRAERASLVEADAQALVTRFGTFDYDVARERARDDHRGRTLDAGRAMGHWTKVKRRIGEMTGLGDRADTATRMAERGDA